MKPVKTRKGAKAPGLMLAYCGPDGGVYEHPGAEPAFRVGKRFVRVNRADLIPLPYGSVLFSLPDRYPVFYNRGEKRYDTISSVDGGNDIWAVSSFLSSGYLRTHLPAYVKKEGGPVLPLWAYAGVVIADGAFLAPAFRIDEDPRSDPEIHENNAELGRKVRALLKKFPENRLVKQLSVCSREYRCLCARNFFLSRYEAPVPTSPACNARCVGCFSHQEASGFSHSQPRINFKPTVDEIAQVMLYHIERVERSVVSFGQGCEGEPLLRARDLAKAVARVRASTNRGTINMNTNGSLPDAVKDLIDAGLDSIRVSLNSPTERYYLRYHKPVNYTFRDVMKTLETALEAGIFVSINLFVLPGFTDMETEVEGLFKFLKRFPVNMIQLRNLNLDPDHYLDAIGFRESEPLGVRWLVGTLRHTCPSTAIGYYNPPRENFKTV